MVDPPWRHIIFYYIQTEENTALPRWSDLEGVQGCILIPRHPLVQAEAPRHGWMPGLLLTSNPDPLPPQCTALPLPCPQTQVTTSLVTGSLAQSPSKSCPFFLETLDLAGDRSQSWSYRDPGRKPEPVKGITKIKIKIKIYLPLLPRNSFKTDQSGVEFDIFKSKSESVLTVHS